MVSWAACTIARLSGVFGLCIPGVSRKINLCVGEILDARDAVARRLRFIGDDGNFVADNRIEKS